MSILEFRLLEIECRSLFSGSSMFVVYVKIHKQIGEWKMQIIYIKCSKRGTLNIKRTVSKGHTCEYYYTQHFDSETREHVVI